jgi:signal peptidase II
VPVGSVCSRRSVGDAASDAPEPVPEPTNRPLAWNEIRVPEAAGWLVGLATIVWTVVVDQGTKLWAGSNAGGVGMLHNSRAALGVIGGSVPMLLLATVAILAVFVVVLVPLAFRFGIPAWVPGLVLGGALSNMIDRVRFGGVRDFITTRWAIVNVADLLVIAGVLILPALLAMRSWHEYQRQTT